MMPTDHDIYVDIQYVMDTDEFQVNSNAKDPAYIVEKFLETRISAGEDYSPVNVKEEYTISIRLDLSEDRFLCSSDCGNKGLREGLLLHYLGSKK